MAKSGYTGISFPFRIGKQGGVVMSSTSQYNARHIEESVTQILNTHYLERPMESEIFSQLDSDIFEPNNEDLQTIMRAQIVEDLRRLEPRIELSGSDITFDVEEDGGSELLYANVPFVVVDYETEHTVKVKVGER